MNRTFKVVFNKARGALTVVNEVTSSVQAKGTKTVIAAAATLIAGTAISGQVPESVNGEVTWTSADSIAVTEVGEGAVVTVNGSVTNADRESNLTISGGSVQIGDGTSDLGLFVGGDLNITGGEVTVNGTEAGGKTQAGNITKAAATIGGYDNFTMTGGKLNLNNARAWVGSWTDGDTGVSTFNDMSFTGGTVNLANGGLTGMSGTDSEGNVVGTHLKVGGTAVVNANSGDKNVINAVAVSLDDEAQINVAKGAALQISTYNKNGLAWENPYEEGPQGKFTMNGGTITNSGTLIVRNDFVANDGAVNVNAGSFEVRNAEINGGTFTIKGEDGATGNDNGSGRTLPAFGAYTTFVMNGGEVTLANGGRIWIGTSAKSDPNGYNRMTLKGGKVTLDGNGWITGNKRLITTDNSEGKHEGEAVLGYNTIGLDGAEVVVNGTGNTIDAVRTELTAGSLSVNGELTVRATVSTNQPTGEKDAAQSAIEDASAFVVTGGSLNIAEGGTLAFNNEIERFEITGGVVTNNGKIVAEAASRADDPAIVQRDLSIAIGNGGTLNTSIFQDYFQVNKVAVNAGGVFNIAALNSKSDDSLEENDRLLIGFGNEWTLAGGDLQVASKTFEGNLKIGTANNSPANKGTGVLNVTAGNYHFGKVEFGAAEGNALNISGGTVAVDKLDTTYGQVNVSAEGTLQTTSDQVFTTEGTIFAETEDQAADATAVSLNSGISFIGGGSLALTDIGYYTSTSLAEMSGALQADSNEGQLVILNAQLASGENGQIVDGFVQATVDATVSEAADEAGVVTITPTNAGVQSVTVASEGAESLAVGSEAKPATFTLTGSAEGGQLVKNDAGEALSVSVASNSTLSLGSSAIESETKGSLKKVEVSGKVEVANIAADVEHLVLTENAKVTVGNTAKRAALDVENLEMASGSSIFLDPAVFGTAADASHFGAQNVGSIAGEIVAGQNAIVSLGASSAVGADVVSNMLDRNGLTWGTDITSAIYLGSAITLGNTGYVVADGSLTGDTFTTASEAGYSAGTLSVAEKGLLAANQSAVSGNDVLVTGKVSFAQGSTLAIVNATEGEFNLATEVTGEANVITDNPFYAAQLDGGKVVTSQDTVNGVSSIASAGMQAMTRRADFVFSQTVADRASIDQELQPGVNLWVDVSGENYQMDGMDYGAEFEADTFYGTFGGDVKLGDAYTLGAAFQYGDGSLRSSVNNIKNDVTNYGLALYGTAKFGAAKVVGELSYIWGENDITASQSALNQSVDTSIYSVGITGQYELKAGFFSFVPSIGLRVSQLETDAMRVGDVSIEDQDQTLFQIPVALRINGADMSAGGWKLAPSFKIAYVPTFGDTEINVQNIETDVIDTNPVQMDFGLRAGTENLLLNATFSLGAGKEGSSSVGGKIGLKYAF